MEKNDAYDYLIDEYERVEALGFSDESDLDIVLGKMGELERQMVLLDDGSEDEIVELLRSLEVNKVTDRLLGMIIDIEGGDFETEAELDAVVQRVDEIRAQLRVIESGDEKEVDCLLGSLRGEGGFYKKGDIFVYKNPVKEAWRRRLYDYVDERLPKGGREHMRVLCLPGKECLEVDGYLELGFSAENIYGVESSKRVRERFLENAGEKGITPVVGELGRLVHGKLHDVPFHVVSLDFTGPISFNALKIFQGIRTADHCVAMVNLMGARENTASSTAIKRRARYNDARRDLEGGSFVTLGDYHEHLEQGQVDLSGSVLKDSRIEALPLFVAEQIGHFNMHDWRFRNLSSEADEILEEKCTGWQVYEYFFDHLQQLFEGFRQRLLLPQRRATFPSEPSAVRDSQLFAQTQGLLQFVKRVWLNLPVLQDSRLLSYKSMPHGTPYHTVLMQYRRFRTQYDSHRNFAKFFTDVAVLFARGARGRFYVADERGTEIVLGDGRRCKRPLLCFHDSVTGTTLSLEYRFLRKAQDAYFTGNSYPVQENVYAGGSVPHDRIEL